MLQAHFSDIGDGPKTVPLGALPLVDGLPVDGVPQLLSVFGGLFLVRLPMRRINVNRTPPALKQMLNPADFYLSCLFVPRK